MKRLVCVTSLVLCLTGHVSCELLPGYVAATSGGDAQIPAAEGSGLGGKYTAGRLFYVTGSRRLTLSTFEEVGVFYGVVLEPPTGCDVRKWTDKLEGSSALIRREYASGSVLSDETSGALLSALEIVIDLRSKEIKIGATEYDLEIGNLFMIRLDKHCAATSEQIRETIDQANQRVLAVDRFKTHYLDDEQVQAFCGECLSDI